MNEIIDSAVLCYVDGQRAYFTTQPLDQQTGDDWDDAPYEHNAGPPYTPCWHNEPEHRNNPESRRGFRPGTQEPYAVGEMCRCPSCLRDWNDDGTPKYQVFHIYFDGPFETPASRAYNGNSSYSVDAINGLQIAWLLPCTYSWPIGIKEFGIPAGTTYSDFRKLIKRAGGQCFEPVQEGKESD